MSWGVDCAKPHSVPSAYCSIPHVFNWIRFNKGYEKEGSFILLFLRHKDYFLFLADKTVKMTEITRTTRTTFSPITKEFVSKNHNVSVGPEGRNNSENINASLQTKDEYEMQLKRWPWRVAVEIKANVRESSYLQTMLLLHQFVCIICKLIVVLSAYIL